MIILMLIPFVIALALVGADMRRKQSRRAEVQYQPVEAQEAPHDPRAGDWMRRVDDELTRGAARYMVEKNLIEGKPDRARAWLARIRKSTNRTEFKRS